jgi:hypothetical protein
MVPGTVATGPAPIGTVRVARSRPGLHRALPVAAGLVALAILKPWGAADSARTSAPVPRTVDAIVATASQSATIQAAPRTEPSAGPGQIACSVATWRIVTLDRLANWTVRTWWPATPIVARGPLDPSIPQLALDSRDVLGIGACANLGDTTGVSGEGVGVRLVHAWRVEARLARPFPIETTGRLTGPLPDPALAFLYRPASDGGRAGSWPAGRYVLELAPIEPATESGSGATDGPHRFISLVVPAARPQ